MCGEEGHSKENCYESRRGAQINYFSRSSYSQGLESQVQYNSGRSSYESNS